MPKIEYLEGRELGNCPFCGKPIAADVGPRPAMLHQLPTCAEFDRMDAMEFLLAVQEARKGN